MVLMALVDANLEFIYVDAGQCGRHADGGIWRNCALNQRIEQGLAHIPPPRELPGTDVKSPYVIVGDGAFPLTEHLQRPYCRRNMEKREMVFNYRLSRARRVSENAFGVMSNRFRYLLGNMQLDPDVATDVVLACCVLHNFLRRRCGKGYIPEAPTAACNLVPIYPALGRKKPTWPNKRGRRWQIILWGWGPFHGKINCSLNFMFNYFVNMFLTFCIYS